MSKNVLLHVGYPKSASSHIQERLFKKYPKVLYHNVMYPTTFYEKVYALEDGAYDEQKALQFVDTQRNEKFSVERLNVIADERFTWNYVSPITLCKRLKKLYPEAKVLLIVRNQIAILKSLYNMHPYSYFHEKKQFLSFSEWLQVQIENRKQSFINAIDYAQVVKTYYEVFGKENVLVLPFERFVNLEEVSLQKLSSFMQVPYNELYDYLHVSPKNTSGDHFLYHLKLKLIPNISISKVIPKSWIKTVMEMVSIKKKLSLDPQDISRIKDLFTESNKELIDLLPEAEFSELKYPLHV